MASHPEAFETDSTAPSPPPSIPWSKRLGIPELVALGLYGALLLVAIPYHESWSDEAQAWEIVRSLPFTRIFHMLSYEGHPGLWYLLLWIMDRLHLSFAGVHWVSGAIAFAGVAVLVLKAPFPRFLRLLLPFTFFLAFQYAVLARSYVLAPLLLFLCASCWPRRFAQPVRIALLLGLLANVVLQASVLSGGLAVVYLIELSLARKQGVPRAPAKSFYGAAALLILLYGLAIWLAFPAPDTSGAGIRLHKHVNAEFLRQVQTQQAQFNSAPPAPANKRSLAWVVWKVQVRLADGLTAGLTGSFLLGCFFWVLLGWKLISSGERRYLIPPLFFVLFCAYVYVQPWHTGLMMLCVITILWMTWPAEAASISAAAASAPTKAVSVFDMPIPDQAVVALFFLFVLLQLGWTEFAVRFDHGHAYSPGKMTARFLAPYVRQGARIVEIGDDFLAVDAQQYFRNKLYLNEPYPFYWWSMNNDSKAEYQRLLTGPASGRPQVVVIEWRFLHRPSTEALAAVPLIPQLTSLGYRHTHTFCGGLVESARQFTEWDCELIFQPQGQPSS